MSSIERCRKMVADYEFEQRMVQDRNLWCPHKNTDVYMGTIMCIECGEELRQVFGYSHGRHGGYHIKSENNKPSKLHKFLKRVELLHCCSFAVERDFDIISKTVSSLPCMSILVYQLFMKNGVTVDQPNSFKLPKRKYWYDKCRKIFQTLGWQYCEDYSQCEDED